MAKLIEMPFEGLTDVGPKNHGVKIGERIHRRDG